MNKRWLLLGALAVIALLALVLTMAVVLRREPRQEEAIAPPQPGGWYEVLFTTPQRTGTPPSGSSGRLDERLVQLIDGAQQSVDMAAYDLGLESVADALLRAQKRGVRVRVVTDTDNLKNPPTQRLVNAGIPVVDDKRSAIMHHKFAVIDGQTLLTGAWNFAERDTFRHNNNTAVLRSPELARNFTNEFEKMFTARRFGPTKPKDVPNPVVEVAGTRVETWFASEQELEPVLFQRVRSARANVAFMAFSFTLDDVGMALQQLSRNGVGVWGVIETTGSDTKQSEFGRLKTLEAPSPRPPYPGCEDGPAVLTDGNPYLLHHKVFVIDERTVIFGSFNFTNNAADDNDEAMLIVDDPAMARQFLEEFCRVYNVAVDKARTKK